MNKHGMSATQIYKVWNEMKQRCHNPNSRAYRWYGARGIEVCEEWRDDFMAFFKYVGPRPDGLSIDRIDPDRGYEPGNVRWATRQEQMSHLRPRAHCPKGHLYTPENEAPIMHGRCKSCYVEYQRAYSEAHRAERAAKQRARNAAKRAARACTS